MGLNATSSQILCCSDHEFGFSSSIFYEVSVVTKNRVKPARYVLRTFRYTVCCLASMNESKPASQSKPMRYYMMNMITHKIAFLFQNCCQLWVVCVKFTLKNADVMIHGNTFCTAFSGAGALIHYTHVKNP